MGEYKKQHTVPRKYLEGFTSNETGGRICQYSKSDGESCWVNPKNATTSNYIYSFRGQSGEWNHAVEKRLSKIENAAGPTIVSLVEGETISNQQRQDFSLFMAAMFQRPKHVVQHSERHIIEYMSNSDNVLEHIAKSRNKYVGMFGEEEVCRIEERTRDGTFKPSVEEAKRGRFRAWMENLKNMTVILSAMNWEIWKAKRGFSFLTSDSPINARRRGHWDDSGIVGIAKDNLAVEVTFPITSRYLLLLKHDGREGRRKATKARVRELNALTIRMANRFVYGQEESQETKQLILPNNSLPAPLTGGFTDHGKVIGSS
jgi:hypothetical protein